MRNLIIFSLLFSCVSTVSGQFRTNYSDIPRIDVHTHIGSDVTGIANCLELRKILLDRSDIDLAIWINLGGGKDLLEDTETVLDAGKGHMLCAIADYSAHEATFS
ncbi:MAG: hypothetical protein U9R60_13980 [Bacteroidota bacterium]|nr:hypothetical protein [Bacteroidota bacterium]